MPVKGLAPSLMECGKIKIGIKGKEIESSTGTKFRPPQKLDHFILTTNEKDENGDLVMDEALIAQLKANAKVPGSGVIVNKNGDLTGIPIRLLFDDIDLNFPTRYASYVGGKCGCTGDGEKAKTRDGRTVACPCECLNPEYAGKDKCKANGALSVIIDGINFFGGCHKFRTTGMNSVSNILASMAAIKAVTGGKLALLPLTLMVQPKSTTIPSSGQSTTVYVVSIVFLGDVAKLRETALGMHKEKAQYLLSMDNIEEEARKSAAFLDDDEKDIAEEFYPETIEVKSGEVKFSGETKSKEDASKENALKEQAPKEDAKANKPDESAKQDTKEPVKQQGEKNKQESAVKDKTKNKTEDNKPDSASVPKTETEQVAEKIESKIGPPPDALTDKSGPVTKDQLNAIVKAKKDLGIYDAKAWAELIKPYGKKSATEFTEEQADHFLCVLRSRMNF